MFLHQVPVLLATLGQVAALATPPTRAFNAECRGHAGDIFFLLDSSSSTWIVDFWKERAFVADLVSHMDALNGEIRVGAATYAEEYVHRMSLNQTFASLGHLQQTIRDTPYNSGNFYIDRGLLGMMNQFKAAPRNASRKVGVLFMDGCSQDGYETRRVAENVRQEGVVLLVIGIGSKVCYSEMHYVANNARNILRVPTFDDLPGLTERVMTRICQIVGNIALPQPKCKLPGQTDIIFVYDAANLGTSLVKSTEEFIASVVKEFDMASGDVRTGMMARNMIGTNIRLDKFQDEDVLISDLKQLSYEDIIPLLRHMRLYGFGFTEGGRNSAKKRAILVLDKPVADLEKLRNELIRSQGFWGIDLYLVNIGGLELGIEDIVFLNRTINIPSLEPSTVPWLRDEFFKIFCSEWVKNSTTGSVGVH